MAVEDIKVVARLDKERRRKLEALAKLLDRSMGDTMRQLIDLGYARLIDGVEFKAPMNPLTGGDDGTVGKQAAD